MRLTWSLPSRVLWIVTHFVGCAPFVVMAVIKLKRFNFKASINSMYFNNFMCIWFDFIHNSYYLSSSSRFSFSFFTRDSIALLLNVSDSPPCLWHMSEWTMLRQASADVGAFVLILTPSILCFLSNSMKWKQIWKLLFIPLSVNTENK